MNGFEMEGLQLAAPLWQPGVVGLLEANNDAPGFEIGQESPAMSL
jgi:hypothetical protein